MRPNFWLDRKPRNLAHGSRKGTRLTAWEREQAVKMMDAVRRDYFHGLPFETVLERILPPKGTKICSERQARLRDFAIADADYEMIRRFRYEKKAGADSLRRVAHLLFSSEPAQWYRSTRQHDSARVIWEMLEPYIFEGDRRSSPAYRQRFAAEARAAIMAEAMPVASTYIARVGL